MGRKGACRRNQEMLTCSVMSDVFTGVMAMSSACGSVLAFSHRWHNRCQQGNVACAVLHAN